MTIKLSVLGPNVNCVSVPGFLLFFSYNTLVAVFRNSDNVWFATEQKYSKTTTRHMKAILPLGHVEYVPQEQLECLLERLEDLTF